MTLLNSMLALGTLAFTIPLAIHLLFRSRYRTLDWGAMHLLDSVVRINRKRIQLVNLLLLLLRCLLPILLAMCLARPVLTGSRSLSGDAPQSIIIAVDDSRSMSAADGSGMTRMEQVKQDLSLLASGLSRRDEVILIRSSRVDAPASSMGSQDALRRIGELDSNSGPVDLGRLLAAAVEAARDASHPHRRILLVADFASANVSDGAMDSLTKLSDSLPQGNAGPVISFLNYGTDSDQLSNVSVDAISVQSPAIVASRGASFSARIRNASDAPANQLRLVWSVDGAPLQPRTLSIPPRSTATSSLTHRMDEPGVHQITVAIEHADALTADNRRSIAVDVIKEIKLLLVDGQPSRRPLESETDFLAIALSPFAFGGDDRPDAVRTTVVPSGQMTSELTSLRPDILVLANVNRLSRADAGAVSQFVLNGGSLVIFDGDKVDPDSYNEGWSGEDGELALPARLGEIMGDADLNAQAAFSIGDLNAQYAPWNLLESPGQRPLADVAVSRYRKLVPVDPLPVAGDQPTTESLSKSTLSNSSSLNQPSNTQTSSTITLLSMSNGDPLVVSARRGRGQVVQFAVPCDSEWTTLPMRMVYLPLVQQLVLDLAGTRKSATIQVGNSFAVPVAEFDPDESDKEQVKNGGAGNRQPDPRSPDPLSPDPPSAPVYIVRSPDGEERSVDPNGQHSPQLVVLETTLPGTYRLRQTTTRKSGEPLVNETLRVVEVPAAESELRDTDPARLSLAAERVGARIYEDIESLQSDDRRRRFGREIWRLLLIAMLVAMIGELFLQQLSIRRRAGRAA